MNDSVLIPKSGSISLLSLGYRGLEAWRAARGTDWIEERRAEAEALGTAHRSDANAEASASADARLEFVIVTGLPRSGTSMLMQMLQAGGVPAFTDRARAADESNPRGYLEHARVKAMPEDLDWLPEADRHAIKVVAPLATYLPEGPAYRVVLIERDAEEVIRSQTRMLQRADRAPGAADTLREVYRQQIARTRGWMQSAPRTRALLLQHRAVLGDPSAAAARLADFLDGSAALGGRPFDATAAAAAVDPSLHREHAR